MMTTMMIMMILISLSYLYRVIYTVYTLPKCISIIWHFCVYPLIMQFTYTLLKFGVGYTGREHNTLTSQSFVSVKMTPSCLCIIFPYLVHIHFFSTIYLISDDWCIPDYCLFAYIVRIHIPTNYLFWPSGDRRGCFLHIYLSFDTLIVQNKSLLFMQSRPDPVKYSFRLGTSMN